MIIMMTIIMKMVIISRAKTSDTPFYTIHTNLPLDCQLVSDFIYEEEKNEVTKYILQY